MSNPVIVTAGLPALARALETTSLFPRVLVGTDVTALKSLATGPELRGLRPGDVVFIVNDSVPSSEPAFPLSEFVRRVSGAGYRVIIVATTAAGVGLHRDFPQTGLLTAPIRLNDVMFALANYGFAVGPLPNGAEIFDPVNHAPASPVASNWSPATPAGPTVPSPSPSQQGSTPSSPASGWAAPTANTGGWQTPSEPVLPPPTQPTSPNAWGNPAQNTTSERQGPIGSGWTPPRQTQPRTLADFAPQSSRPQPSTADAWSPSVVPPTTGWGIQDQGPALRSGTAPQYPNTARPSSRRGMVITVSVSKGGTGKSTLSLNLAAYLGSRFKNANPSRSVCIIDCNYQQADTGKYMGQFTPNIVNLVKDPSLMTPERITSALVHRADMNFSALLGPATPDDALALLTADTGQAGNSFSARFYNEVLELLRPHFDYIFIDTPVAEKYHSLFRDFALPVADYLIVPVIPSKQTVHNTYMWLNSAVVAPKVARGAGLRPEQIGIVLNRAEDGVGYGELEVMEELRMFNFLGSVPETTEWKRANNEGELIAARNKSDINEAFARILGQVTGEPSLLHGLPVEEAEPTGVLARIRTLFQGRR